MEKHPVTLEVGTTYLNHGGGKYRCLFSDGKTTAVVRNVASGWTCEVHGTVIYDDGTIEWDYSKGGHFE